MDLSRAANYFVRTPISGWNGTQWVADVTRVALVPFDRFISERQFGNNRRHVLVEYGDTAFDQYPVIRFGDGHVYLVGYENHDVFVDPYSRIFLLHRALYQGTVYGFTKTAAVSGMNKTAVRTSAGVYWTNVERVTLANSPEFDGITFSQTTVTLPRNCQIDTDNEILIDGRYYDIKEVNKMSGFVECRALQKRSS
jgi:hypothetical protein